MRIVVKGPLKVVGIEVVAAWEDLWTEVPRAWEAFVARHDEVEGRVSDRFIDISADESDGVYTQMLCTEVSEISAVPDGMTALELPLQSYLHRRHESPAEGIASSFGAMYDWARHNDHALDGFKLDIGYTTEGPGGVHDLFVRVAS